MSKILEKLANRPTTILVKDTSIVDLLEQKRRDKLKTVTGVAHEYGVDDELDLVPISREEDALFCFEGSIIAHWCELRMQDRIAEETLRIVYNEQKSMICGNCRKLWPRCVCVKPYPWLSMR